METQDENTPPEENITNNNNVSRNSSPSTEEPTGNNAVNNEDTTSLDSEETTQLLYNDRELSTGKLILNGLRGITGLLLCFGGAALTTLGVGLITQGGLVGIAMIAGGIGSVTSGQSLISNSLKNFKNHFNARRESKLIASLGNDDLFENKELVKELNKWKVGLGIDPNSKKILCKSNT